MKERLKKFYQDHKEAVVVAGVAGAYMAVTSYKFLKLYEGLQISSADVYTRSDGASIIEVYLNNGMSVPLKKND